MEPWAFNFRDIDRKQPVVAPTALWNVAPGVPFQPAGGVFSCGSMHLALLSGLGGEGSLALPGMKVQELGVGSGREKRTQRKEADGGA